MSNPTPPITGKDTISTWLAHPTGGPIIRECLGAMGQGEDVTGKIINLPLNSLVELSQGKFTQEAADDLVRQANGGIIPEETAAGAGASRFNGKTVIVTGAASGIVRPLLRESLLKAAVLLRSISQQMALMCWWNLHLRAA